jgi:hypothetical protein
MWPIAAISIARGERCRAVAGADIPAAVPNAELVMADLSLRDCHTSFSSGSVRAPDEFVMLGISATDTPFDGLRIHQRVESDPIRLGCLF